MAAPGRTRECGITRRWKRTDRSRSLMWIVTDEIAARLLERRFTNILLDDSLSKSLR